MATTYATTPHAVGHVTTSGETVCLDCGGNRDLQQVFRFSLDAPIVDPAPDGIYHPGRNSHLYDAPCWICGWAIRRVPITSPARVALPFEQERYGVNEPLAWRRLYSTLGGYCRDFGWRASFIGGGE